MLGETILLFAGLMAWFIGGGIIFFRLHLYMEETEQKLQKLELSLFQEISEIKRQCKHIRDDIAKISKTTSNDRSKINGAPSTQLEINRE